MRKIIVLGALLGVVALAAPAGCGDDEDEGDAADDDGRPEDTGAACVGPDDCYLGIDRGALKGDITCMDRVRDGYCTHTCTADTDCCAVEGECDEGINEVCAPFESEDLRYCFLSCEEADLTPAPGETEVNDQEYCRRRAGKDFICRSSGGGDPRKVCVPGDCGVGADCGADADCGPDLVCSTNFLGGYCTKKGCTVNTDCPGDSLCVAHDGENYCYSRCGNDFDCGFCRNADYAGACRDDVSFVQADTAGTVCVPPGG